MDDPSITNGEKLKQLMQDEEIRKKFEESLQKNVFFILILFPHLKKGTS